MQTSPHDEPNRRNHEQTKGGAMSAASFHFDAASRLQVANLPEDFADWLMDDDRDEEAREVLARVTQLESIHDDVSIEQVIDVLEEYGEVIEINQDQGYEPRVSYWDQYQLVREMENVDELDGPVSWDREAQMVNQAIKDMGPAKPLDLDEHEYPVVVYVRRGVGINELLARCARGLARAGYRDGVRNLAQDLIFYTRLTRSEAELFQLAWSYVDIVPVD